MRPSAETMRSRCLPRGRRKPPATTRRRATLMSSYFGPYLQQPADESSGRFLGARVSARVLDGSLGGGGSPRRRSASDDRPRAAGIAFQPDGALACRRRRPVPGHAVHRRRARSRSFPIPPQWTAWCSPTSAPSWPQSFSPSLQARYQGALAPTIASYNADKERVQVWWDAAKGLPEELFIDSIPYQQTRAYVRQVLTNYAMYQRSAQSASPRK